MRDSFNCENLFYEVKPKLDVKLQILECLKEHRKGPCVIYRTTPMTHLTKEHEERSECAGQDTPWPILSQWAAWRCKKGQEKSPNPLIFK